MNKNKFLATSLAICLLGMNISPVYAFKLHFTPLKFHRKKAEKVVKQAPILSSGVNQYKYNNVNMEWWKNFSDPILSGYIDKAIENNHDMQAATIRVEEARQAVKIQFAHELPSLTVGLSPAEYKSSGSTSGVGSLAIPILASYELDYTGKNHIQTQAVKKQLEEAKFQERAVYISIASEIGSDYINIVNLDKQISLQNKIINSRKQIYELMKIRNKQGITSTADLVRANKAYVVSVSALSDLKKQRKVLLNTLAVLMGDSSDNSANIKRISYEKLKFILPTPVSIPSNIIVQRPDYLTAEKQVEVAGIDVRVARKELLPTFDIFGLAMFATSSVYSEMSWRSALAAIAGSLNWTAYAGGAKVANVKLKKAQYEEILQNYYKTNLNAFKEVNDSLSSLKLDSEKFNKNVESYNMEKSDFNYMKVRYNEGIISYLDLEQQKENLYTTEKLVVSNRVECLIDRISLYKAAGGKFGA